MIARETVANICTLMDTIAPLGLSESWDNTGLLLGDAAASVERVMTCLTLSSETVAEAVERRASLVIAHHPLPFKPLGKITTATHVGKLVWELARAGISVYAPHTAWDSAELGINAMLADLLELRNCRPLIPDLRPEYAGLGAGRIGQLSVPSSLSKLTCRIVELLPDSRPRGVDSGRAIQSVAIACGSGGSFLEIAQAAGCDLFLTGEATFHTCLEAQSAVISLLMVGHFASERFAMSRLAERLREAKPTLEIWASKIEKDPVRNLS